MIREYIIVVTHSRTLEEIRMTSVLKSFTIAGLRPYTVYRYKVAAYTVATGPFSEEMTVQTGIYSKLFQRLMNE